MKLIVASIIFIHNIVQIYGCASDWASCQANSDCCHKYCLTPPSWRFGLCIPVDSICSISNPSTISSPISFTAHIFHPSSSNSKSSITKCEDNWFNKCTSDDQCCSRWCNKKNENWEFGVCTPIIKEEATIPSASYSPAPLPRPLNVPDESQKSYPPSRPCEKDYFNDCVSHSECCSGFCERHEDWKYGICKPGINNKINDEGTKTIPAKICDKKIVGYFTLWDLKDMRTSAFSRFTHLIVAYFKVEKNGTIKLENPNSILPSSSNPEEILKKKKRLKDFLNLKKKVPGLKIMFSVGGQNNSDYFSEIVAKKVLRETFIDDISQILDDYEFDGVDIDWRHPVGDISEKGKQQDKKNYVDLMAELRFGFDEKAKALNIERSLLTFAGPAVEKELAGYDLPELLRYADWVNVMTFDFIGTFGGEWLDYTFPPAPLYHNAPPGLSGKFNVNWAIKTYVCKLGSPQQVVMGIPLYGTYWTGVTDKTGEYAIYRKVYDGKVDDGIEVSWKDIKKKLLGNTKFRDYFDDKVKVSYAYREDDGMYLGYESPYSVKEKIKFAVEKNLGGLMVWNISQDDDDSTMVNLISSARLCTNNKDRNFKCSPIDDKRWWSSEIGEMPPYKCGKDAPPYKGYYPVCDPDDLAFSCCGPDSYCGSGSEFCDCPTCTDYGKYPEKISQDSIRYNQFDWSEQSNMVDVVDNEIR